MTSRRKQSSPSKKTTPKVMQNPLRLTNCISALIVGHWAISSRLSKALVHFSEGQSKDNVVVCNPSSVPGDKAAEAF
ncbi:hypothetical protein ACROYT_G016482 [Oculina patagonica]